MRITLTLLLLICTISTAPRIKAMEPMDVVEETPVISLLTCAPGNEIYELEGHSGLRLKTERYDVVANWGVFDFNSPNFVYRFVKGETDYMAVLCPTELFLNQYRNENRRVAEQILNLTPEQANRVKSLVSNAVNVTDRIYRYNYVRNNCATKPALLIEAAIGDTIQFGIPANAETNDTWRKAMRRYHSNYPWYQFGIDLALGTGIDFPITNREQMFAPVSLMEMMASATITDSSGTQTPLVKCTDILCSGDAGGTILPPTPWYLTPMFWCIILMAVAIAVSLHDIRRKHLSRWFDILLYSSLGAAGLLITFLVFVSEHEATSPNYLILWINPLCLLVTALVWNRKISVVLYIWQWLNLCAIISFSAIWISGIQNGNTAIVPLMLTDAARAATFIYLYRRYDAKI